MEMILGYSSFPRHGTTAGINIFIMMGILQNHAGDHSREQWKYLKSADTTGCRPDRDMQIIKMKKYDTNNKFY